MLGINDSPRWSIHFFSSRSFFLISLVELVPGERTEDRTISEMKRFFEGLGKVTVMQKREAPGHMVNRLAAALLREVTDIVLSGIASVEDGDKALIAGPGIRWALMGQLLDLSSGWRRSGDGKLIGLRKVIYE